LGDSSSTATATAITPAKPEPKSWVQQFVERASRKIETAAPASPVSYVREAGSTVGEYLLSTTVGGLLGATHAKWGLDATGVPIDGVIAGAGALLSIGLSGVAPQAAEFCRTRGSHAAGIYAFRQAFDLVAGPGGMQKRKGLGAGVGAASASSTSAPVAAAEHIAAVPVEQMASGGVSAGAKAASDNILKVASQL
jgi:hypothetical protein